MRINLLLHQPQLQLLACARILLQLVHELVQLFNHAVKAVHNHRDFVFVRVFHAHAEITLGQALGLFDELLNRRADAPVDHDENQRQRQQDEHRGTRIAEKNGPKPQLYLLIQLVHMRELQINILVKLLANQAGHVANLLERHVLLCQRCLRGGLLPQPVAVLFERAQRAAGNAQLLTAFFQLRGLLQSDQARAHLGHIVEQHRGLQIFAARDKVIGLAADVLPRDWHQAVGGRNARGHHMVFPQKALCGKNGCQINHRHADHHDEKAKQHFIPDAAPVYPAEKAAQPAHSFPSRRYWLGDMPVTFLNSMLK